MSPRRESALFALALAALIAAFFHESLFGGKVLSPGDVVFATAGFGDAIAGDYEPSNRLLMDPVLQFAPWLEFTRSELRSGRLPLWNPLVGCGAPHLANGQSAVFDPFHVIAYLGTLPDAIARMAAARLWVAGLGAFLLARSWGYSRAGRVLSGLAYPFCGFLVAWLLYPVTSVAVWMPWLFLATDRAMEGKRRGVVGLAIVAAFVMLGGHVQTSAHVLLADGAYAAWRWVRGFLAQRRGGAEAKESLMVDGSLTINHQPSPPSSAPPRLCARNWIVGLALGLSLAAIEIVPLAAYLARSPVWADRRAEKRPVLKVDRPRLLDASTTAFPYVFGSQRRGHPNLARALGVHNLNESAGGFAGLATLIWLAPAAWSLRRDRPRVRFLAALGLFGALGAFGITPVSNLLRAMPVLDVADNRRLTLWVAFALAMLGGIGIDAVAPRSRIAIAWSRSWVALAALLAIAAVGVVASGPKLREKAIAHYAKAAASEPGADAALYRQRAERQADRATTFLPRYLLLSAAYLLVLAAMAEVARKKPGASRTVQTALIALVVIELFAFGYGLNPAIARSEDRPDSALIAYLRREVPPPRRIIAVGAELPPNLLMRYGLADARNYDSVELERAVVWLDPLYEPEPDRPARTSRRTIRWEGVIRAKDRLRLADVAAVVGATPPPEGAFGRVDRVGRVWVARPESLDSSRIRVAPGEIRVDLRGRTGQVGWIPETFDPGWAAEVDGEPASTSPHLGTFLGVDLSPGARRIVFRYRPVEVRIAAAVSLASLAVLTILAGAGRASPKNGGPALEARFTPG